MKYKNQNTIYSGGCLGYLIDEERSKERYLLWIAELRESSKSWTQPAPRGNPSRYTCLSVEYKFILLSF